MSNPPSPTEADAKPAEASQRLVSLDALRGFDMFWILGGEFIVVALYHLKESAALAPLSGILSFLHTQMEHVAWEGFHFYDLIFPLFVFITGVSAVFSLSKSLAQHGHGATLRKVFLRSILLYAMGLFYYAGMEPVGDSLRYVGVLQRIAMSYFFAGILFCFLKTRGLAIACAVCLVGYWLAMSLVPVADYGAGNFEEGKNLANWFDLKFLPGYKWDGPHDPEGLLSGIPAVGTCILGLLAGILIKDGRQAPEKKVLILIGSGIASIALGYLWSLHFPVIKKLWTSSYVLVAAGYSAILLAVFYFVVDMMKLRAWAAPFVWIGMNPLTLYMIDNILSFRELAERIVKGSFRDSLGAFAELTIALLITAMIVGLARFLFKRKIFLRL